MAAKLGFVAACLGLVALASGAFLSTPPVNKLVAQGPAIMNTLAAFDSKGLEAKEIKEMESAIEALVTQGDDPATRRAVKMMNDFILKTMIPNREKMQATDQETVDTRIAALKGCSSQMEKHEEKSFDWRSDTAADHKDDYQDAAIQHGQCVDILEGKKLLKETYCATVEDSQKLCQCDGRMGNYIAPLGLTPVDCSDAPEIPQASKQCCDAYVAHAKTQAECTNHKADKDFATKQHKIIMNRVCEDYDTCYDTALKNYNTAEKAIKNAEATRGWGTVYHIQCLVSAFDKNGKVSPAESQACKDKDYEIKKVEFPTVPSKEHCTDEIA